MNQKYFSTTFCLYVVARNIDASFAYLIENLHLTMQNRRHYFWPQHRDNMTLKNIFVSGLAQKEDNREKLF